MRLDCLSIPGKSRVVVHRRESVLLKGYFVAGSILITLTNNPNNILMNQGHCVKAASLRKPRHEATQDEVCAGAKRGGASLFLAATSFARAAHRSSPALVSILPFALQLVLTHHGQSSS